MSKIEVNTIDTIAGSTTLTLGSTNATLITLDSGAQFSNVSGQNYPAFDVSVTSSRFLIPNTTVTKVEFNTTNLDTNSYWDGVTNYRFTPLVAGKYFVYVNLIIRENNTSTLNDALGYIYKNGASVLLGRQRYEANGGTAATCNTSGILNMNGSTDYIEAFAYMDSSSHGGVEGVDPSSNFGAYRIGA